MCDWYHIIFIRHKQECLPARGAFRLAGAALYHGSTLPLARFRMHRLMRLSDRRAASLSAAMTPQEAAVPTPESSE